MAEIPYDESVELALSVLEAKKNHITLAQQKRLSHLYAQVTRLKVKELVTRIKEHRSRVTYGTSFEEMIQLGNYYDVDDDISEENFPSKKLSGGEEELSMLRFNARVLTTDVLAEFQRRGLQAAALSELLALEATHPFLHRDLSIAAFGGRWRKFEVDLFRVPVLFGRKTRRMLHLSPDVVDIGWDTRHGFLAVPE